MKTTGIKTNYKHQIKKKLKELFGTSWASKVAEKEKCTPVWVREVFRGEAHSEGVIESAKAVITDELDRRGEFLEKIQ